MTCHLPCQGGDGRHTRITLGFQWDREQLSLFSASSRAVLIWENKVFITTVSSHLWPGFAARAVKGCSFNLGVWKTQACILLVLVLKQVPASQPVFLTISEFTSRSFLLFFCLELYFFKTTMTTTKYLQRTVHTSTCKEYLVVSDILIEERLILHWVLCCE